MPGPVWLHFATAEVEPYKIGGALAAAGLSTVPFARDNGADGGVLVFDVPTAQLCDFVREASADGYHRVLAVATTAAGLTNGAAWQILHAGASDVFSWDHFAEPGAEVAARFERWCEVDATAQSRAVVDTLVGSSRGWRSLIRQIVEVATFTDLSVLITGESGTGKELVARLIHRLDRRPGKRQLVVLDCTTVVPTLSGSEFFGHERGAFTGAANARDGVFALADHGTLFLDEVGELTLGLQAELLRVVQEGTYKRVGSNAWRDTRFRLICATNRDLLEEEQKGAFRRDFYHRIAAWRCHLPSLHERAEDILPLARHFLREFFTDAAAPLFDPAVEQYLVNRQYPGNVRELRQLIQRIARRHVGPGPVTVGDIPADERAVPAVSTADWADSAFERCVNRALADGVGLREIGNVTRETAIRLALRKADGNLQRAARALGITDRALQQRRAARLGLFTDGPPRDRSSTLERDGR